MSELAPMDISTQQWSILLFTAEVILVSIAVGGLLLLLIRRSRQQINQLEARNQQLQRITAGKFIERELGHTRTLLRSTDKEKPRLFQLLRLRRLWLEAEQCALVEKGNDLSDTTALIKAAAPLLTATPDEGTQTQLKSKSLGKPTPKPSLSLAERARIPEEARNIIATQKEIISQLQQRYQMPKPNGDAGTHNDYSRVQATLKQADSNTDTQQDCIAKLERELKSAKSSYQQVSMELAHTQAQGNGQRNRSEAPSEGMLVVSTNQPNPASLLSNAQNWLDELENSHTESMQELASMRDVNSRQRRLILQLEREIEHVKKSADEQQSTQNLLQNLREQLRNYENCTATLEAESEELRSRIATLNSIIKDAQNSGSLNVIEQMQEEISRAHSNKIQHQRQQQSLRHIFKITEANSIEAASPHLLAWLRDLNLDCAAYIKGEEKQYWLSGDGSPISSHIRQLLLSFVPSANQPWAEIRGGIIFVGTCLRLYIHDMLVAVEDMQQDLEIELAIINTLLMHIDHAANQNLLAQQQRQILESLRQQYARIDTQQRYLSEENQRIGEKLHQELEQYFESIALTSIQQECIEGCLSDYKTQLALLSQAAKGLRNQLRLIGKSLADQTSTQNMNSDQ